MCVCIQYIYTHMFFGFCQQCVFVLYESKSGCWQTLTVSVMVIVCQSLGGAAQQAIVWLCVCACVPAHISRKAPRRPHNACLNSQVINLFNPAQQGVRACVFDNAFMCKVEEELP